jgi:hypothetical protein
VCQIILTRWRAWGDLGMTNCLISVGLSAVYVLSTAGWLFILAKGVKWLLRA